MIDKTNTHTVQFRLICETTLFMYTYTSRWMLSIWNYQWTRHQSLTYIPKSSGCNSPPPNLPFVHVSWWVWWGPPLVQPGRSHWDAPLEATQASVSGPHSAAPSCHSGSEGGGRHKCCWTHYTMFQKLDVHLSLILNFSLVWEGRSFGYGRSWWQHTGKTVHLSQNSKPWLTVVPTQ